MPRAKDTSQQRKAGRRRQELLREENAPRDAEIYAKRHGQHGGPARSVIQLADEYELTRQAIYDILEREKDKAKRGRRRSAA